MSPQLEPRGTDALIQALARDAQPVRQPLAPTPRALLWMAITLAYIAAMKPWLGFRPDLAVMAREPAFVLDWVASIVTAVTASLAAFHLRLPDRDHRWIWAPIPSLVIWLAASLYGVGHDWATCGADATFALTTSWGCARFILMISLPSGIAMAWLLRSAAPIRPVATITLATLAVAAAASTAQSLYHDLTTALMVIVWHGGTVAACVIVGRLIGPALMRRMLSGRVRHAR